jgi:hypothetical protein
VQQHLQRKRRKLAFGLMWLDGDGTIFGLLADADISLLVRPDFVPIALSSHLTSDFSLHMQVGLIRNWPDVST